MEWLKARLRLKGYREELHWRPEHAEVAAQFLQSRDTLKLIAYMSQDGQLAFLTPFMRLEVSPRHFMYFVRADSEPVTRESVHTAVQFGRVNNGSMDALHKVVGRVYMPLLKSQTAWPEGIAREFDGETQRFMAALTETAFQARGQTVLYLPDVSLTADTPAGRKEVAKQLNQTLIHWTRQIKAVLSTQEGGGSTMENAGPLAEIEFWRRRVVDLSGISEQLKRPGVQAIVQAVSAADTQSWVANYHEVADKIQSYADEAADNLRFLELLTPLCTDIDAATPPELPGLLKPLLARIRVMATVSKHYRSPGQIKTLLRKVSNAVMARCRAHISLDDVFVGDVPRVQGHLAECVAAIDAWKGVYASAAGAIAALPADRRGCALWDFDEREIFAQVNSFQLRCHDLQEVCLAQQQFARKCGPGGEPLPLPVFGGSRGPEIVTSLTTIQAEFGKYLSMLARVKGEVLKIRGTRWHDVNNIFKPAVRDLEAMMGNVITLAFDGVTSIPACAELLEAFSSLAKRPSVKKAVEKAAADVYSMFMTQMMDTKSHFEAHWDAPPLTPGEPPCAGAALWTRGLQARVERDWEMLCRCHFVKPPLVVEAAGRTFDEHMTAYDDHIHKLFLRFVGPLQSAEQAALSKRLGLPLMRRVAEEDVLADEEASATGAGGRGGGAEGMEGGEVYRPARVVARKASGLLEVNFDPELLELLQEVHYWDKFQGKFLVPFWASDLSNSLAESLRVLRDMVMTVVREYNGILRSLTSDERALFAHMLHQLDRRVAKGLTNMQWSTSPGQREYFLRGCRRNCAALRLVVDSFHASKGDVRAAIHTMRGLSLIHIEKNKVHEEGVFERRQAQHRLTAKDTLRQAHESMVATLRRMYRFFQDDPPDVQRAWLEYVQGVDAAVYDALRHSVKASVLQLQRAIKGDAQAAKGETELAPLFRLYLVLDGDHVEYRPTVFQLIHMVYGVAKDLITCIGVVKRVEEVLPATMVGQYWATEALVQRLEAEPWRATLRGRPPALPPGGPAAYYAPGGPGEAAEAGGIPEGKEAAASGSGGSAAPTAMLPSAGSGKLTFFHMVSADEDVLTMLTAIMSALNEHSSKELQRHKQTFENDKYRSLWDKDKESTFSRFAKKANPLSNYENHIQSYRLLAEEIRTHEAASRHIYFVQVDHKLIKDTLIRHCDEFQAGYCNLLKQNALRELRALQGYIAENTEVFRAEATDLAALHAQVERHAQVVADVPVQAARLPPLHQMFDMLERYNERVGEEHAAALGELDGQWAEFVDRLPSVADKLKAAKANLRKDLSEQMASFTSTVVSLQKEAKRDLPYDGKRSVAAALTTLEEWGERVASVRAREASLAPGIKVFDIPYSTPQELLDTEADLEKLATIWALFEEWEAAWGGWKAGRFADLDPEELSAAAASFKTRVTKMRELAGWSVWGTLDKRVREFLSTMPLVEALGSEAMRPRHWAALKEELNKRRSSKAPPITFDETSAGFTLDTIFSMGLHNHEAFIQEMAANATKELSFERALEAIEDTWADLDLDMGVYKDTYYKISGTEDLFGALEEHLVDLSSMKSSKYYGAFRDKINHWEATLSTVSEVVDLQLAVQRQWVYLESIFVGAEDIRKQMAAEATAFDAVNEQYIALTTGMVEDPNAVRACGREGVLPLLNSMNDTLESIQKKLNRYLESKRQAFPRFYFVSDADLLEILGQAKDPHAVQKHMIKCFMGIKALTLVDPGKNDMRSNRHHEATAMSAPDGEVVPLESAVPLEGAVEHWMNAVEAMMRVTLQQALCQTIYAYKDAVSVSAAERERSILGWIRDYPGQLLITTGIVFFTRNCITQLQAAGAGNAKALRRLVHSQHKYLTLLASIVRQHLNPVVRKKIVALITMELHSRDVMDRLRRAKVRSVDDFLWISQLRLVYSKSEEVPPDHPDAKYGICRAQQTNADLKFGYEYQGNNGRLVVTPLTDRCVLTLTTALALHRGGAPAGPAGTGKTETVKDLGKNLAKFVVVFNCSDGLDYKSVGRMFSGLVQSGGWGCFDEFNRIDIEVLSVVAQQVMSIMDAVTRYELTGGREAALEFMGEVIQVRPECGIFITMNPGYAGRTELPDNLKSLFRPVAMMVPDLALIAEVMLQSEGFTKSGILAEKTTTLYSLMTQQLSKQDHYDFGLRSLRGVLVAAGALKRSAPERDEFSIALQAIRDMNVPKFIKADKELFMLLLSDLFQNLVLPEYDPGALAVALKDSLSQHGLQAHPAIMKKCIELRDSKSTRHCNMLVGLTLSGKSTTWRTLADAFTALATDGVEGFNRVQSRVINPKSISLNELYGAYDLATQEWTDGILSNLFREFARDDRPDEKWLVLDGPVDTLWIESMNTVMDDNKTLTLINGDRISMSASMSLLFEVRDLAVASPATVSRAGMVYLDVVDLGSQPFIESWLNRMFGREGDDRELFAALFAKYLPPLQAARSSGALTELVPASEFSTIIAFANFLEAIAEAEEFGFSRAHAGDAWPAYAEKWFAFALTWTVGGAADEGGRRTVNDTLREVEPMFPAVGSVYDYYLDPTSRDFRPWTDRVAPLRYTPGTPYAKLIVPTVDTTRLGFVLKQLVTAERAALLVGGTGTGKTALVSTLMEGLPREQYSRLVLNFSAATTSNIVQSIVEGGMEKRAKDKMGPPGGRKMLAFVDDLNMPRKDAFGSQPPLELLRQWMDYGGWYDRAKQSWRYILDMQMVAAMGPPGGGRMPISDRFQSRFHMLHFTPPSEKGMRGIFDALITPGLADFEDEVRSMGGNLVAATVAVYHSVLGAFLPTPTKAHYLFNMRDVSKVVQGVIRADPAKTDAADKMQRVWVHECLRVFADRFTNTADQERFRATLDAQLSKVFGVYYEQLMEVCEDPAAGPIVTDVLTEGEVYTEVTDVDAVRRHLEEALWEYNEDARRLPMELVLFRDALRHVLRIHRIVTTPRGNALLIGVGGSGRQSLTRLAAYAAGEMAVFSIEITKQYGMANFREDLKALYAKAGLENKPTVFLFSDTQLKEESFLEDINNILSSGEVPNLYLADEMGALLDSIREALKDAPDREEVEDVPDQLWRWFIARVRANLHVVLAMSPVGDGFRDRTRQYPSLVSSTTMDWFHKWPEAALTEVAERFLENVSLTKAEGSADAAAAASGAGDKAGAAEASMRSAVAQTFATVHSSVVTASARMELELKRYNYVTPTNYLELVKGYRELLAEKRAALGAQRDKLASGLAKLDAAREEVAEKSVELNVTKDAVAEASADCDKLLLRIVQDKRVADDKAAEVEAERERISHEATIATSIAEEAEADLNEAMPKLELAMRKVDELSGGDVAEVKRYTNPPLMVERVMAAVQTLFGLPTDWAHAKKKLSEADFLSQIKTFDKEHLKAKIHKKVKVFIADPSFVPEVVQGQSRAAAALCTWVIAIDTFADTFAEVEPKRRAAADAMATLRKKEAMLAEAEATLKAVTDALAALNTQHEEAESKRNSLKEKEARLTASLDRATALVDGLAGEKERWEAAIAGFEGNMSSLPGDVLLAAAFTSYAGPFDTVYRERMVAGWAAAVLENSIPGSPNFDFSTFLARPTDVQAWKIQGLPADTFSTENGVIVTRGRRWPLMVDPQGQANKWIKNMEGDRGLKVTDLKSKNFLQLLEKSIVYGTPYLLQDVEVDLDPALEPVLAKSIITRGVRKTIKVGDKELDYSDDFRFYLTTKMANPHYTPEVSTKVAIVNFAVKEAGLDAQMLSLVVQLEQPELETEKDALVKAVAAGKSLLVELEDKILSELQTVTGSLIENDAIMETLQASQTTSADVTAQLAISEEKDVRIEQARQAFRPVSQRAALLYFVLNDLGAVDPMYQFSLAAYSTLFQSSIKEVQDRCEKEKLSAASKPLAPEAELARRIDLINAHHTLAVYKWACLGLFEEHKTLLSLQICVRKLQAAGKVPKAEWDLFLKGGVVLDRAGQRPNPAAWLKNPAAWDSINVLDTTVDAFSGIVSDFEQDDRSWREWWADPAPESAPLPRDWDSKLSELQRLILVRALRPDRVLLAVNDYISTNLGPEFTRPPPLKLADVERDASEYMPLVFVLSPGTDPTSQVVSLHERLSAEGLVSGDLASCSLGQGQDVVAEALIRQGLATGSWVLLQNCHLSISWMPRLEKIIEEYCTAVGEGSPADGFRLWLSSAPHPKFPISILQRSTKITLQPPRGLAANMKRMYNTLNEEEFEAAARRTPGDRYKNLLFMLTWFHAILLERRKFKSLGWNIPYDFNNSDYAICNDILVRYLERYPDATPWDALRYLIAEANYGGRITDDMDRRLCNVYINKFFNPEVLSRPHYPLSPTPGRATSEYFLPDAGDLAAYIAHIDTWGGADPPEVFGQHPNADITSAIQDTQALLSTVLSLQPREVSKDTTPPEVQVLAVAEDMAASLPPPFDLRELARGLEGRSDPAPLKTVLLQELARYQGLLHRVRSTLADLQDGIAGRVVITPELEEVFDAILAGAVPKAWGFCYPSLKPLGAWVRDLISRCEQMAAWGTRELPRVFWLSGFTYPTSFFTALLQTAARKAGDEVNNLDFEFPIFGDRAESIQRHPDDGAFVRGLFLEGAQWDDDVGALAEPQPMDLFAPMPIVHFKPVNRAASGGKRKRKANQYACPLYYYPIRTGTRERPSFMRLVTLDAGPKGPDFWTLRGTALLLSLDS